MLIMLTPAGAQDVISYSGLAGACAKAGQWAQACMARAMSDGLCKCIYTATNFPLSSYRYIHCVYDSMYYIPHIMHLLRTTA